MSDAGKQAPMRLVGWNLARQISWIIKRKKKTSFWKLNLSTQNLCLTKKTVKITNILKEETLCLIYTDPTLKSEPREKIMNQTKPMLTKQHL